MSPRYRPFIHSWEAVYAADFTLDHVRQRCASVGKGLAERGWSCLVAYDTRFMGNLFARAISSDLLARGLSVKMVAAPSPLPALHHALDSRLADCALFVSACNRQYFYNGLVLLAPSPGLSLDPAPHELPPAPFPPAEPAADPPFDLRADYLEALRAVVDIELIRRTSMTIFVDAMSGTTAGVFPTLLGENGQTRAIEINREADPLFGKIAPRPAEAGLNRLKKLVRESDSHLGLAISADGTALAVVDKNGEQIDLAETTLLLAAYLARQHRHRGMVVGPAPGSGSALANGRLATWDEANGLKADLVAAPEPLIQSSLEQERPGLLIGCSAEGEITIGRFAAYPDAMLAGLLIAEMVARNNNNLRGLIEAQRELLKI